MTFHTLAVTGVERLNAVHSNFAGRDTGNLVKVLTLLGVGIAVLFGVLAVVHYVQQQGRKRREVLHRAEMDAKLGRATRAQTRY